MPVGSQRWIRLRPKEPILHTPSPTQLEKAHKTRKKTHLRFRTPEIKKTGKTFWRRIPLEQVYFSCAAVADNWSWRRDLNPRPSDYKSDALPAELRQQTLPRAQLSIDT